ncbi:thymidine kinase [Salinispira pacifica]|uniref:Thymidine kinase n=1 Tax=Salinispira pacifica TaxID=1307761 RepID=V5WHK7_9SPIO|nr:thymidine kinase [Salinispira pacifica]AHC15317.1 Thymidine kinase [Salinispira pacifica]
MLTSSHSSDASEFFKSLGLPNVQIHHAINHFDFTKPSRRILVIGPMGSGKTEYSARIWRDARVALNKSKEFAKSTVTQGADRRNVFFIRSILDLQRFSDYPEDALAYRGGFERLGENIARISDSFGLEKVLMDNPEAGTWILDEASFYDERIAYVTKKASIERGLVFVFPTLILNFRKDIFNSSARLLLDTATDVFPLTAYCEHADCMADSFFTYRYYRVDGQECPALYFDPLIIVGGDNVKDDPREPNYCTRCEEHHYLPGKEYTFLILKPLGLEAARGNLEPLKGELSLLKEDIANSGLASHFNEKYDPQSESGIANRRALLVPNIAERALIYLFVEQNLIGEQTLVELAGELSLDQEYINRRLEDNGRVVHW